MLRPIRPSRSRPWMHLQRPVCEVKPGKSTQLLKLFILFELWSYSSMLGQLVSACLEH